MAIDFDHEELVAIADSVSLFPPAARPSIPTIWRWCLEGKLGSVKVGNRRYTTRDAVSRFIRDCTAGGGRHAPTDATMTPTAAAERAGAELAARGI